MQSQGSGVPESRYTMSYSHASLAGDGVDLYGHGPDPYVLQHQHHMHSAGMSPTGHLGLGSPGQHHGHAGKRSADVAGLNLKQDPMVGDVSMSSIGMGHSTMDDGGGAGGGGGGQSGPGHNGAQAKKTPPPNGKKTKGRVKIKMEFIDNKLRRYTTFSKRKTGIMKKAYELSTLTGTQVMLLVASETGHVYTFATRKLQPMITSEAGKALIQTCLNSPDPPSSTVDQRMSATGFEETELTYTLHDEDQKEGDTEDDENEAPSSEAGSRSSSPEPSRSPPPSEPLVSVGKAATSSSARPASAGSRAPAAGSALNTPAVDPGVHPAAASSSSSSHQVANGSSKTNNASGPVNLTASQLANLAANLPALSALPGLPGGANLATLLASVSASMAGQQEAHQARNKSLPQLISLAHLGATLQQAGSAKESCAKNFMMDQKDAALDLHNIDKKGATGSKSRNRKSKK